MMNFGNIVVNIFSDGTFDVQTAIDNNIRPDYMIQSSGREFLVANVISTDGEIEAQKPVELDRTS